MLDLSQLGYRLPRNQTVRPDKWNLKFDGTSRGISVNIIRMHRRTRFPRVSRVTHRSNPKVVLTSIAGQG